MATITPSTAGNAVTYQNAAGGGDQYAASAQARLHVRNGGGSPITVTIKSQAPCSQGTVHDTTVVIGNAADKILGPYDPARYADANGFVQITYTGVTSVTVGVIS